MPSSVRLSKGLPGTKSGPRWGEGPLLNFFWELFKTHHSPKLTITDPRPFSLRPLHQVPDGLVVCSIERVDGETRSQAKGGPVPVETARMGCQTTHTEQTRPHR